MAAGRGSDSHDPKAALSFLRKGCALGGRPSCAKAEFLERRGVELDDPPKEFSYLAHDVLSKALPRSASALRAASGGFRLAPDGRRADALASSERRVALMCADAGEEDCAATWMMNAASDGDAEAMSDYALWLEQGIVTQGGKDEMRILLQRATSGGSLSAQRRLAVMDYMAYGRERNCKGASSLLENAAGQGDLEALVDLGVMKALGCGLEQPPDNDWAMRILRKACSMGSPDGCRKADLLLHEAADEVR